MSHALIGSVTFRPHALIGSVSFRLIGPFSVLQVDLSSGLKYEEAYYAQVSQWVIGC